MKAPIPKIWVISSPLGVLKVFGLTATLAGVSVELLAIVYVFDVPAVGCKVVLIVTVYDDPEDDGFAMAAPTANTTVSGPLAARAADSTNATVRFVGSVTILPTLTAAAAWVKVTSPVDIDEGIVVPLGNV